MNTPRVSSPSSTRPTTALMIACASLCAIVAAPASAAPVADDFESYAVGSFPAPTWSEFATFFAPLPNDPPPVVPSMTVVNTTDAFGHATKALQNVDVVSVTKGVYAPLESGSVLSVSADLRTLRYSPSDANFVKPYQDGAASVGMFTANPNSAPFLSIYASATTHGWRLGYSGDAALNAFIDDYDLGAAALVGVWYRVSLELDRDTGSFHSRITDIASGIEVVDKVITYANWQPGFDNFDSILFAPTENGFRVPGDPGYTLVANLMQVDNINAAAAVPEPASYALMVAGLVALAWRRQRIGAVPVADGARP